MIHLDRTGVDIPRESCGESVFRTAKLEMLIESAS